MKEFWNNRYKKKEYAYGKEPNKYFREEIDKINPGKILLAAGTCHPAALNTDL